MTWALRILGSILLASLIALTAKAQFSGFPQYLPLKHPTCVATQSYTIPGTYTYTGCLNTTLTAEVTGNGAQGQTGGKPLGYIADGGGAGAYATGSLTIVKGATYIVVVQAGVPYGTTPTSVLSYVCATSWASCSSTLNHSSCGSYGAPAGTFVCATGSEGLNGATALTSVGTTTYGGGNGGAPGNNHGGGGGGGGAGSSGGAGSIGGAGTANGGAGGAGGAGNGVGGAGGAGCLPTPCTGSAGSPGAAPGAGGGGGGGGAGAGGAAAPSAGGAGAAGQVKIHP